ncbi:MAG: hypothetical protein WBD22_05995 [Pyrinomonadaceae bacterium]
MTKKNLTIVAAILLIAIQAVLVRAAWGDWDPDFGNIIGGAPSIVADTDLYPASIAIQPDGKILVTGYRQPPGRARQMFLLRFLPNGGVDMDFGRNGFATFIRNPPFEIPRLHSSEGERLALLPDGDITVSGRAGGDYAVWRFSEDGVAVMGFGSGGVSKLDYPASQATSDIAVQGEKLIVGVGKGQDLLVVIRLNERGRQDRGFGNRGEVETDIQGQTFSMFVETENGKITIGGLDITEIPPCLRSGRLMPDGESDPSFFADFSNPDGFFAPRDLLRLSNQKYVFRTDTGSGMPFPPPTSFLTILDMFGGLETRFPFHTKEDSTPNYAPVILAQQSDGKVIVSGHQTIYSLNSDLDPGSAQMCNCDPAFELFSNKTSAVLQPDNKMVTAARHKVTGNLSLIRTLPPSSRTDF